MNQIICSCTQCFSKFSCSRPNTDTRPSSFPLSRKRGCIIGCFQILTPEMHCCTLICLRVRTESSYCSAALWAAAIRVAVAAKASPVSPGLLRNVLLLRSSKGHHKIWRKALLAGRRGSVKATGRAAAPTTHCIQIKKKSDAPFDHLRENTPGTASAACLRPPGWSRQMRSHSAL